MAGIRQHHSYSEKNDYNQKRFGREIGAHDFDINLQRLESVDCPRFSRPEEVTTFSVIPKSSADTADSSNESLHKYGTNGCCARTLSSNSHVNRRDISLPKSLSSLKFDLNVGYGKQVEKDRDNEFLNLLLMSLDRANLVGKSEFACWRGLFTKLAASPYDAAGRFDDGLKVVAQKVGGVIYLYEFPTEEFEEKQKVLDDRNKAMQYWGMKFESYVTAKRGENPVTDEPMDFNYEYGSVVRAKLGSHSLVFGGEIDCAWPQHPTQYIELKTSRECSHAGQERSFRKFKLLKWWLQSFLIGIEDILCGFRDDNGIVRSCEWYKVSEIPKIIKQDRDTWRPSACLAFLNQFLDFIRSSVTEELVPHVFARLANQKTFHLIVDKDGIHKFLPSWFIEKYTA
ncbi:decapping and exoribonuclease protein-like [Watersipora subatra]|uniref:decapping and exoribonuclease protein-like n=1 Tax=Watersipora subatra TaxID=2589382 RepID=UPI00355C6EB0